MRQGSQPAGALREMRRMRRRRYVERLDVMDLLYRAYLFLIFGGIALAYLGGVINEATASPSAVDAIRDHGPAVLGIAVAIAVLAGLRTGARGGPLAIEAAEVQYVLLAPIDRGAALRPAAGRQLRVAIGSGLVLGAVVASFALRRLPGSPVEWLACLALFGALVPVSYLGAGLFASGRRLGPRLAGSIGLALIVWSAADFLLDATTSPASFVGVLGTLPLQSGTTAALAAVGAAAVSVLLAAGLVGIGGMLLEAARRRSQLAAELRFSASVQDLRTVVLLRRQLAAERPRRKPWLRLGVAGASGRPIPRRAWQSFLRWPPARIGRVTALAVAAGVAAVGAWHVSIVLAVVPGALLFVAALDLVEPLAQEADHPTRGELLPVPARRLYRGHLIVPGIALVAIVLLAALAATAVSGDLLALAIGAVMALPTGAALSVCAAISATNDPYQFILTPQLASVQTFGPLVAALLVCGAPLLGANLVWERGGPAAVSIVPLELVLAVLAFSGAEFVGGRMSARRAVAA